MKMKIFVHMEMRKLMNEIFGKECLNCQEWDCSWCPVYIKYKEKIERWEDEHNFDGN